jgi:hypothetical protein
MITETPAEIDGNTESEATEGETTDQPETQLYSVDIDGEKGEVDIEELRRGYQMAKASQAVFRKAKSLNEQSSTIPNFVRDNPIEALKQSGHDFGQMAEKYVLEQAEYEMLDENERRATDAERLAGERAAELEKYKSAEREQGHNNLVAEYKRNIGAEFEKVGIQADVDSVAEVAFELNRLRENGEGDHTARDAVAVLFNKRKRINENVFHGMTTEQIVERLGEERMKEVRKHDVAKLNEGNFFNQDLAIDPSKVKPFEADRSVNKEQWSKMLRTFENS